MKRFFLLILILFNSCAKQNSDLIKPQEKNFKSLKQLTFGGDNAEAYWSFDDKKLCFNPTIQNGDWSVIKCSMEVLINLMRLKYLKW